MLLEYTPENTLVLFSILVWEIILTHVPHRMTYDFCYRPQFVDSSETLASEDNQINLYIIGSGGYTQALESEIRVNVMC